jgi:triacylglycerol lipase
MEASTARSTLVNLILAHGFLGFRTAAGISYFAGIAHFLRTAGHRVLVIQVDPIASIATRSQQLQSQILQAFGTGDLDAADKAYIIAHSMGGLDARHMLSPANPDTAGTALIVSHVATLTTISTPHRGSPIADLLVNPPLMPGLPNLIPDLVRFSRERIENALARIGIGIPGLKDLTSESTAQFNEIFKDNPAIRYFSVAGTGRGGGLTPTCAALLLCHEYMKLFSGGDNDGLVPVDSAKWGNFDSRLWPFDHADEIGHNLDDALQTVTAECLGLYSRLLHRLSDTASAAGTK